MASTSERRERALGAEEPSEFQGTHWYNPVGWDRFDPRPHPGSGAIAPGARVQSFGPMRGAPKAGKMTFHHIRDEAGNEQSVFKGSLSRKRPQVPEEMKDYFPGLFNDRRAEGRRESPR